MSSSIRLKDLQSSPLFRSQRDKYINDLIDKENKRSTVLRETFYLPKNNTQANNSIDRPKIVNDNIDDLGLLKFTKLIFTPNLLKSMNADHNLNAELSMMSKYLIKASILTPILFPIFFAIMILYNLYEKIFIGKKMKFSELYQLIAIIILLLILLYSLFIIHKYNYVNEFKF